MRSDCGPVERIEFSRPSELPGVEILLAEHSARRWRAFHETYTISTGLKLRGPEFEWTYRRRLYRSDAGRIMLMEPGEVHANTRVTASADFRVAFVSPAIIEQAAQELGLPARPHLRTGHVTDRRFFHVWWRFHQSLEREATPLERQSRFAAGIRLLLEQWTETPRIGVGHRHDHPGLDRARSMLLENPAEPLTLDDLAAEAGLSRYHLARSFTTRFGMPPHTYQLHVRLLRARALLASGVPSTRVAADLGFADQSHFVRHFKAVFGSTPSAYQHQATIGRRCPLAATWQSRSSVARESPASWIHKPK